MSHAVRTVITSARSSAPVSRATRRFMSSDMTPQQIDCTFVPSSPHPAPHRLDDPHPPAPAYAPVSTRLCRWWRECRIHIVSGYVA
eukprot:TRINITY_DN659_c0_g1_i2.p3 TRINITY_DN659_c0_g1~~TRINITY_DN659_c0_g1_i2.p3  ORF type:complete len:101 (+),score=0.74 TRINITY_DN659_c0_g1_i2:46-303(+)